MTAAAALFNRDGFFGTDTNRIARAAGYSPATFYKYFKDKREVFLAAYQQWVHSEETALDRLAESVGSRKTLAAGICRTVLDHHQRWVGFRNSLVALEAVDESIRSFRVAQRRRLIEGFARIAGTAGAGKKHADLVFVVLVMERICDAIARGEAEALGADPQELRTRLEALLVAL